MRVRWTTDAADDLERICDYIARHFRSLRFTRSVRAKVKFECSASYTAPNSGHHASWLREQAARES